MDVSQYVHFDVNTDYLRHWVFYYTLHSHMDAPKYVHVDVSADHL